jgi:hypothetical protein
LKEIVDIPLVAQLLMLFERGFLPATMAALLGEKERAAAFAEKHPLAWIDICPPVLASNPAPEKFVVTDASPSTATCCA